MADTSATDSSEVKKKDLANYNSKLHMRIKLVPDAIHYMELLKGHPAMEAAFGNLLKRAEAALASESSDGLTMVGFENLSGNLEGAISIVDAFIQDDYIRLKKEGAL